MFVEHLRFRVAPRDVGAFLVHNRRWLAALRAQPGFIAQRVYRHDDEPEVWLVTIAWRDKAAMVAFPEATQRALDEAGRGIGRLERAEHYREAGT